MTSNLKVFRRILITRMKFVGDVVLTTPTIRAVRDAYPDAYIAYLGEKHAVSLLEHNPHLDEVIGFDFSRSTVLEQTRVALLLRRRTFDLVIDLFGNPRSALLTYLSGAPMRVGLDRKGRGKFYTIRIPDDGKERTAIQFHSRFAEAVGVPAATSKTEIVLTEKEKAGAELLLREFAGEEGGKPLQPLVGIHPGATWPAKRWLADRFAGLADRLTSELGARVLVTSGPEDSDAVRSLTSAARMKPIVLPVMSLRQLAAVIALCNAYVSNDAGPMHIAAAVGTPTIGLFGPGEENIWFPYSASDGHRVLRRDVPCHPCHLDFCNRDGEKFMECMKLLTVNDVFSAVLASLRERSSQFLH
jgi:lipopolysaccharide heptosyltransferase II